MNIDERLRELVAGLDAACSAKAFESKHSEACPYHEAHAFFLSNGPALASALLRARQALGRIAEDDTLDPLDDLNVAAGALADTELEEAMKS